MASPTIGNRSVTSRTARQYCRVRRSRAHLAQPSRGSGPSPTDDPPCAQRHSMARFCPSTRPCLRSPSRKSETSRRFPASAGRGEVVPQEGDERHFRLGRTRHLAGPAQRHATDNGARTKESAAVHCSITLVALLRTDCGIVRPCSRAVLRLMTNRYFVACSIGIVAGCSPLRMRTT